MEQVKTSEKVNRRRTEICIVWTALVFGIMCFSLYLTHKSVLDLAVADAKGRFKSTLAFRNWVAGHNGVYVGSCKPEGQDRSKEIADGLTPIASDDSLILLNPACAIRDLLRSVHNSSGIYGHLIGWNSPNEESAPDAWEAMGMHAFDEGDEEFHGVVEFKGESHLRFMQPLRMREACFNCHGDNGRPMGATIGAISFAQPMKYYDALKWERVVWAALSFSLLWLAGLLTICWFSNQLRKRFEESERLTDQLLAARDEARGVSAAKSEFLANISHELRTPLNGLLGMVKLLRDSPLGVEQREYAEIAMISGESLAYSINNLLDYSRADAGLLRLSMGQFNAYQAVESVLIPYEVEAQSKGLSFTLTIDERLDADFLGDKGRFQQLISNLVGNAIKFTGRGGVQVSIMQISKDENGIAVLLNVNDTGIGFDLERLPYLFEPFTQNDSSTCRHYQGAGMGLAIVKRLVDAMGGSIAVDSDIDVGSSFYVTLRLTAMSENVQSIVEDAASVVMRILLWSDNDSRRETFRRELVRKGNHVTTVVLAEEVVDLMRLGEYDCLLFDGEVAPDRLSDFSKIMQERGVCRSRHCVTAIFGKHFERAEKLLNQAGMVCIRVEDDSIDEVMRALVDSLFPPDGK